MKVLSIMLTALLIFPIAYFAIHILSYYGSSDPLKAFGITATEILTVAMPSIVLFAVYLIVFFIAVFLNIKKRYRANTVFIGVFILLFNIIPLLFATIDLKWFLDKF